MKIVEHNSNQLRKNKKPRINTKKKVRKWGDGKKIPDFKQLLENSCKRGKSRSVLGCLVDT